MKIITKNKKAFHDYEILHKIEAGIVLMGDEVKSIRAGNVNLTGSYATVHKGELFLLNANVGVYTHAYEKKEDTALRSRKLLVHRRELDRLIGEIARKGVTIVPLALYFSDKNKIKVELGVAKHKKAHERKEELRERDIKRQTARELKNY